MRGPRVIVGALLAVLIALLPAAPVGAAPPAAPTQIAPANGAQVQVPFTLSWSQVLDPTAVNGGYNWEISTNSTFSMPVARDSTRSSEPEDTVSGLANGTYFWRVQAVNATVEVGPWSATRSFEVTGAGQDSPGSATLNQPQGGTEFHPWEKITWTWSAVPGAVSYTAEWSQDSRFLVNETTYQRLGNIPDPIDGMAFGDSLQGTWFMRVSAVNAQGIQGRPSNVISFSVRYGNPVGPPPTIIAPVGNPTLTLPITLTWTDGYNPQDLGYEVQVSSSPSFSTIEQPTAGHTDPRRVLNSLTAGQKFWRVRSHQGSASATTAAVTAWSQTGTFTISSAPAVPASVTLTRDPLYSDAEQRLSVQLTGPAPAGGAQVQLTSSNPSALPVPASLTIAAGFAVSGELILHAGQVTAATPVTVTATYNGTSATRTITVQPPTLKTDPLQPVVKATGGADLTGRLDLAGGGLAPTGGVQVSVTSDSTAASVPATVTIPAGAGSTAFTIRTSPVATATTVTIRATHAGVTAQWQLFLHPAPRPASLTLNPAATTGGSQGIVTIPTAAIAGFDQLVRVTSSNPAVASAPEFATIPASQDFGRFTITTSAVSSTTNVTFSVTGAGTTVSADLTVFSALPALTGLSVSPTSVAGGGSATGTVTLGGPAPAGGVPVNLGSNQPGAASVPQTVTVAAGATSATFTVTTFPVDTTTVQLSASLDGVFRFAALGVTRTPPPAPAAPSLLSPANGATVAQPVALDWSDVSGAASYRIQIDDSSTFSAPFVVDTVVTTSQFTAPNLSTRRHWWRVRGVNSGGVEGAWSSARRFTPQAAPATASLSSVAVSPSTVVGGSNAQGTVTLTAAAPSGGASVALSSSSNAATVPGTVTVPAGSTSATFPVTTSSVTTSTPVTLSGVYAGATRSASLTVSPPAPPPAPASLSSVAVSPSTVVGGSNAQGTVTLTAAAPSGGASVALSSSSNAATVPGTVTVPAGSTSATFPVTTSSVTASTPVTLSGVYAGVTRSASLTVTPQPPPTSTATLSVTATGRSGERVTSSPAGISVNVGSTGSASFAVGTSITLSVAGGRDAIWSGACSSGGNKTRSCTFTLTANASVTANVQ